MTTEAAPPQAAAPTRLSPGAIIREAWGLLTGQPRAVLLPFLVIELPVAIIIALVTSLLLLTALSGDAFIVPTDLDGETPRAMLFMWVAAIAGTVLFSQVARAAAIASIAAAATGKPKSLTESLDVAFTRMGAVLAQALMLAAVTAAMLVSLILIPLLPYFLARWGVATEAMVLEGVSPMQGIRRSWELTRSRVLRFLGTAFLAILVVVGPALLIGALDAVVAGSRTQRVVAYAVVSVVQPVLLAPAIGFITTAITLFYLKARALDGN